LQMTILKAIWGKSNPPSMKHWIHHTL
jgi:hypothetical protein